MTRISNTGINVAKRIYQYSTAQFKPSLFRDIWQPVIGLEVHAQILSKSKLFSRVSTKYGAPPNTQVGIFEAAHPGTLPALNKRCVEAGIKTALALRAKVHKVSWFDRKHYFYPDLPAGFQITQKDHPIASDGCIDFIVTNTSANPKHYYHSVRLTQLQLEEDSGKSIHDRDSNRVLVDLNRAGMPLMELVFAPDLRDGEEAAALVKELALILMSIGTCSCKMGEGALRVDANISVHKPGEPFGERTEVKNLNTFRSMVKAINYEVERQVGILEAGGTIVRETRRYDAVNNVTVKMRDKDTIHDYRFMPEPNLPPLRLHDSSETNYVPNGSLDINHIRKTLGELPEQKRQMLIKTYGINLEYSIILVNNNDLLEYFLSVMSVKSRPAQTVCNLLINNVFGIINALDIDIKDSLLTPQVFGEIVDLLESGEVLYAIALKVIKAICDGDKRMPREIVHGNNWTKLPDNMLEEYVREVFSKNPKLVKQCQRGKKRAFNNLMNKAVEATECRADMGKLKELLMKKLEE